VRAGNGLPFAAFAGATVIWGTTFLAVRIGVESVPPLWAATLRLVLASLLLFAIMRFMRIPLPRGSVLAMTLLFGALEFGVTFALLYWAEQHVNAGVAATIFATLPLLTGIFAWTVKLELLTLRKLVGAVISFVGVALIFAAELQRDVPLAGLVALVLSVASMAAATIVLKRTPPRPVIMSNAVGAAVGAVICLAGSALLLEQRALPRQPLEWGPILYLTLAGSLGAFLLFTWVARKWNATSASMVFVLIPLIAMVLDAVTGARIPSVSAVAGAALVLAGVTLVLVAADSDAIPQLLKRGRRSRRVPIAVGPVAMKPRAGQAPPPAK